MRSYLRRSMRNPIANYSVLDRLLHRWIFSDLELQWSLAKIEDRMYAQRLRTIDIERPVFISGVPRAGTTLLLELLAAVPKIATHTYRVMPFVLAPLLWNAFSRPFLKLSTPQERAHGDGLQVSFDSPEA